MSTLPTDVRIPDRFCGPPTSANGGWACGTLGRFVDGVARVRLHVPPPLETDLLVVGEGEGVALQHGDTRVASATTASIGEAPMAPVSWALAEAATDRFVWKQGHPYPSCFVCGPESGPRGLHVHPGAVEGRQLAAAPFEVPDDLCDGGVARPELVWALLDCPSYFGHVAFASAHRPVLLGQLTASVKALPRAGQRCVVGGWSLGQEGRKIRCRSALWSEDGETLAEAEAIWIELRRDAS